MSKDLKDNPTTAVHTGDRQRMSVAEEEKFKDDLMKQAEGMIKKGEVEQQEDGQWIDNKDIMKKLNEQRDQGFVEDMTDKNKDVEIRKGIDPKSFQYELLPPQDPRVRQPVAPFKDEMLEEYGLKSRQELVDGMFALMHKYGGIGLSAIQIGLPFNMFVAGDHESIEKGLKIAAFNPVIIQTSSEDVLMKEGCLTFPFLFVSINRPRKCVMKYEDENRDLKEAHLDGMMSRVCQHEYDHQKGELMVQKVSKLKLDLAYRKAEKEMKKWKRYQKAMKESQPQKVNLGKKDSK
jgi:peptide deformylase|tara:strand:+ start:1631 stop:2503 length:873 start_codon:yes stop_codon:yes gene_type:complete